MNWMITVWKDDRNDRMMMNLLTSLLLVSFSERPNAFKPRQKTDPEEFLEGFLWTYPNTPTCPRSLGHFL